MATDPARITTPERTSEVADAALRPKSLDEFIGQEGFDLNNALVPAILEKATDSGFVVSFGHY